MRIWLSNILNEANSSVIEEAKNEKEVIRKFLVVKPDIVLIDIIMSVKSGVEALSDMMRMCPNANVVNFFSMGQKSIILKCLRLEAKDFVVKRHF